MSRYQLNGAGGHAHLLVGRLSLYWNCFNPAFLFVSAEDNPVNTTFRAGVFLLPVAAFLVIGAKRLLDSLETSSVNLVLFVGLLAAPLGVVIVNERTILRLLVMLPFAVLIAAGGVAYALDSRRAPWRMTCAGLLMLMPVQFAYYGFDYFHDYRRRAGGWMEHNRRAAWTRAMDAAGSARDDRVYLAANIPWAAEYWRFFAIANHREDLLDRASLFNPAAAWMMPSRSVILTTYDPARHDAPASAVGARVVATVSDEDDVKSFSVFRCP
jgi:hypothetical protein